MVPFVQVEAAPAYELLMTLAVMSDTSGREAYELDTGWYDAARRSASGDLLQQIDAWGGSDMLWAHLVSLAYESPPPRDVPAFLAHLTETDAMEVRLHLLGYYGRALRRLTPPHVIAAAAAGDRAAQDEFLRSSYPDDGGWQRALAAVIPLDAESTKRQALAILHGWNNKVFRAQEQALMAALQRDAESKQALLRTSSALEVLKVALPGYEYVPELRLQRVLLIPSLVVRPLIHTLDHADTRIFVYGVADESMVASSDTPHPRLMRLARALGDERRLRILRRLASGDCTLHELATHFGVRDTTLLHHLVILRGAGLVRVREGKRYHLERHAVPEMGRLLETYLDGAEDSDPP